MGAMIGTYSVYFTPYKASGAASARCHIRMADMEMLVDTAAVYI